MIEHEGEDLIKYHYHHKGDQANIHRFILLYLRDTSHNLMS